MGTMGMGMDEVAVPDVVKEKHAPWWWSLLAALTVLLVVQCVGLEICDAIFSIILAVITYYMIQSRCKNMSKCCIMLFGIICVVQAIFEIVALFSAIGGRKIKHTQLSGGDQPATRIVPMHGGAYGPMGIASANNNQLVSNVVIESHPFFDKSMGMAYNVKGVCMILGPLVMIMATYLSYWTYKAMPDYDEGDHEAGRRTSDSFGQGEEGNQGRSGSTYSSTASGGGRIARPRPAGPVLFSGSGQRLGG